MNFTKSQLKRIIAEEYIKEETLGEELSPQQAEEMLAWIRKQGPKPAWLGDDYGHSKKVRYGRAPADPNADRAAQTMPFPADNISSDDAPERYGPSDIPSDDAPESHVSGFQDRAGPPLEDQVTALVQELPPEEMLDLFTAVIEKLAPEYIEPQRREIGFREVKYIIQEVLNEVGDYHFGFGDEEKYDALDPHGFGEMTDAQLVDMAWKDGIEKIIILDGEGDLVNREEVLAALKNV